MSSILEKLTGKTVSDFAECDDGIGIIFECGDKLSIYNKYNLKTDSHENIVGKKIINIVENNNKIVIFFDNGSQIIIFLDDESWNSPEALEVIFSDGDILVWN